MLAGAHLEAYLLSRLSGPKPMAISVIICTRDRADSLEQTLESLFSPSNVALSDWEAIVVDNDSGDKTAEVCGGFKSRFPERFHYLVEKRRGKSNALNSGIAAARGQILAFTDDDVRCAPDYIQAVRAVFDRYPADAVQGRILLDCEAGHPVWLDRFLGLTVGWRDCGSEVTELEGTLCGTNMLARAEVLHKVGGFLPDLGPGAIGLGEETELTLRMRQAGCRMLYAPQILIWHRLPKKRLTKEFIRRRFFQQGRAGAYYEALPVSIPRFALYVMKTTFLSELAAFWQLCRGRPALALRHQCEARSQAGLLWQHWLFKRGAAQKPVTSARDPKRASAGT